MDGEGKKQRRRFPMNKVFTEESSKFSIPIPTTMNTERESHRLSTTERRPHSSQRVVEREPVKLMAKSIILPQRVVFQPQLRQSLTFHYEQTPPLQTPLQTQRYSQPSPKMSVPPTHSSSMVREPVKFSFSHDNPQIRAKANSLPIIQRQVQKPPTYQSSSRTAPDIFQSRPAQQIMIRSPHTFSRTRKVSSTLGMEAFVIENIEKVESSEMIKKTRDISLVSSPPRTVQFQLHSPNDSRQIMSTPSKSSNSLSQITIEFKNLLKSEEQIEGEDTPETSSYKKAPLSFENSEESLKVVPEGMQNRYFNQASSEELQNNWQIEMIKEVDEQVSYSVDDHKQ